MMRRLLLLCLGVLWLATQAPAQDFRALVETANGLWVADMTGRIVGTVASNAGGPFVAAFSPDGQRVAYSPAQPATRVLIADLQGRTISETEIEQSSVTAVMRLGWAGANRLWVEGHTGPYLGTFELWELPADLDLGARKVILSSYGHSCTLSPDATAVACLGQLPASGKRFMIVAGDEIYPDPPTANDTDWRFEGVPAWSRDGQQLTAVQASDSHRWLLSLRPDAKGWRIQRRSPGGSAQQQSATGAFPAQMTLAGRGKGSVLDWSCSATAQ